MGAHAGLIPPAVFRRRLIAWYEGHHRDLPWRRTSDPYHIWISEIMLQQTRAQAVIPYYQKFLARFPSVAALAAAPLEQVLAAWAGLGYYSRARNLHRAARQMAAESVFPRDYEALRALAGVGDYTAAAVASIAFALPYPVLDGNVLRVLARLQNDHGEITSAITKANLRETARRLLDRKQPGRFNQALMELGATLCVPRSPQCQACPVAVHCAARLAGTAAQLPVKLRRTEPVEIAATVVVVERRGRVLLRRRVAGGRMEGFWELPELHDLPELQPAQQHGEFRHTITHHHFVYRVITGAIPRRPPGFHWIPKSRLPQLPISTAARKALNLCAGNAKIL
jgi:A/G-specific adenine glycosylase